ncbi:thiolase family protein [Sciscionella marina]|uniref:thiolase family protein n=1 Tax=Sciscionella marina TaxID=508770 RepID=UPI00036F4D03|nr:thiolase family protein [Sciscionella marina]
MTEAGITGSGESPYRRHPGADTTTESVLTDAAARALRDAGRGFADVDGLAVASFTLAPDHAVDLAWRLGLRLRWIMEDTNGGGSGINMLGHAVRAVAAGECRTVLVLAGDAFPPGRFHELVTGYNRATTEHLAPLPLNGPNALFALLTQRQLRRHGLERADYGAIAVRQRSWAAHNPGAVYRAPLTIEEYLAATPVAPPLHRYDCVPVVTGADALLVEADPGPGAVRVRAMGTSVNPDDQEGDGLVTGIAGIAPEVWERAGCGPGDLDLVQVYDDYPAMVLAQLADLGLVPDGDLRRFLHTRWESLPCNTSGGQLSAGQAGAGGGLHGLVEAVRQLRGQAGQRQVEARLAAVTGYGMVLYRYGALGNLAVLEAV